MNWFYLEIPSVSLLRDLNGLTQFPTDKHRKIVARYQMHTWLYGFIHVENPKAHYH